MKKIATVLILFLFLSGCASKFTTLKPTERYGAQVVENKDLKAVTKYGRGIQVVCSVITDGQFITVMWAIHNPNGKILNIKPYNIKLYDQVQELNRLEPKQLVDILYGGQIHQPPSDPFSGMGEGLARGLMGGSTRSQTVNAIYSNAFKFGETNSYKITGTAYYSNSHLQKPLTAEITLDGQTFKFEFE